MMNPEPKCIQWKRQGAERVLAQTANMSREQEIVFLKKRIEQLRLRQIQQRQLQLLASDDQHN